MGIKYEDLWKKSQVFIERAIESRNESKIDEFNLWASIALELLGKSTLAKIHPSLVVDPSTPKGLLIASGYSDSEDYKTITAKTVFDRLRNLIKVKRFDEDTKKFCTRLANLRNAELHSGELPFVDRDMESWLPKFWDTCKMLLEHQGKTLEDYIGESEAKSAEEIIHDKSIVLQKTIESKIHKFKQDALKRYGGELEKESENFKISWINEDEIVVKCPACTFEAVIEGEALEEGEIESNPDDPWIFFQDITFLATSFTCRTCGLVLGNHDEIVAAGLDQEFTNRIEVEPDYEPDYGND
ncbi:hypothetical protein [Ornithinibacillus contaminans]|uniref:hypothetical protein n=1 Tax=Ornithinibacillus contaminans TaxID=694055 RepID=UPI00064DB716|nr:hypothetical protein [Ornithinibacillus contaminans]